MVEGGESPIQVDSFKKLQADLLNINYPLLHAIWGLVSWVLLASSFICNNDQINVISPQFSHALTQTAKKLFDFLTWAIMRFYPRCVDFVYLSLVFRHFPVSRESHRRAGVKLQASSLKPWTERPSCCIAVSNSVFASYAYQGCEEVVE